MHRKDLAVVRRPKVAHDPEDSRALGMTDVLDPRLSRLSNYVINHGRQIKLSDLIPGESPEGVLTGA